MWLHLMSACVNTAGDWVFFVTLFSLWALSVCQCACDLCQHLITVLPIKATLYLDLITHRTPGNVPVAYGISPPSHHKAVVN